LGFPMIIGNTMRRFVRSKRPNCGEHGYVLLVLLLVVAMLVIAAAVAAPTIAFEIKRDREEELVHRGVEYSRAIQRFVKANRRYPLNPEDLQSVGGVRYIRKLYRDPITGGDFRLLYLSDVRLAAGTGTGDIPPAQGNTISASTGTPPPPAEPASDSTTPP